MRTLQALFNRIAGIAHDEADRLYRAHLIPVTLERPACWRRARRVSISARPSRAW